MYPGFGMDWFLGGSFMFTVEVWGVGGGGGKRDGLIYGQGGLFCFCRSHLTNDESFLHFRWEERDDDNNNDLVGIFAN